MKKATKAKRGPRLIVWINRHAIVMAVIAALITAGGLWAVLSRSTPKYTGPVETIRIGVSKASPEVNLLFFIAEDRGFFRDNGLAVQLVQHDSSVHIHDAVAAKKVDTGISGDFTFVADSFKRQNLSILTGIGKLKFLNLIVRTDAGIRTPEDLKGKRIALVPKTSVEFLFNNFLTFNNLAPKDMTIVPATVDQLRPLLTEGKVDGITFTKRIALEIEQELPGKVAYWSIQEYQPNYVTLIVHKDFAPSHHATFKRFLTALVQAQEYLETNQDESLAIAGKHLSPEDKEYLMADFGNFKFDIILDQALLLAMEDEARWVIDNKLTDKTKVPNYLNYIYFDALQAVEPERITIIR